MAYRTILTNYGLQRLAAATAAGVPINLTHMAVGDGNGNPTTPTESQTALVGEKFRAAINRVYQDSAQQTKFITELVIPADIGGFVVREMGVYDDTGGLFAVANVPDTYKPTPDEGAFSDAIVRAAFLATNATVITLQVDPNVAVATQQWIINNITPAFLIPGGTTGQNLTKRTNTDGDVIWSDPTVTNVVVDVIEEPQTLADAQTTVSWNLVTTRGLAVYVEGIRINKGLGADEWMEDSDQPDTRITLGKAYLAGTNILGTQNEPSGAVPFPLVRDQNLSDVPDIATARTNIDVFSKAETRQMAPSGEVSFFAFNTAPAGWLKANGALVSRTVYAELFAAIGTRFGAGNGVNTFQLPDLRGEFLRGWDDGRGVDTARVFGAVQASQNLAHGHNGSIGAAGGHAHSAFTDSQGQHAHSGRTSANGDHNHAGAITPHSGSGGRVEGGSPAANSDNFDEAVTSVNGAHDHTLAIDAAGAHGHNVTVNGVTDHIHGMAIEVNGGAEARPRNVALLACIKF